MATHEELITDWHEHALQDARGERIGAAITIGLSAVLIGGAFVLEHANEPVAAVVSGILGGITLRHGFGEIETAHDIKIIADKQFADRMKQISD
ncbi:MAG: hypothetical protein QG628_672 [Patescibacteria group bacterium]|jgi:hypothetical protein|nr:hypothetical protein [Patescibacteria group bacterium]